MKKDNATALGPHLVLHGELEHLEDVLERDAAGASRARSLRRLTVLLLLLRLTILLVLLRRLAVLLLGLAILLLGLAILLLLGLAVPASAVGTDRRGRSRRGSVARLCALVSSVAVPDWLSCAEHSRGGRFATGGGGPEGGAYCPAPPPACGGALPVGIARD